LGNIREKIRHLVIGISKIDKTYVANTTKLGCQENVLWLLYALDDGEPHSQKQICDEWGFPRTTLNTITKKCETAGYLTLSPIPGKRRERQICLTESGKAYAKQVLGVVYRAESKAMEQTLAQYSAEFISALDYYEKCLALEFENNFEQNERR